VTGDAQQDGRGEIARITLILPEFTVGGIERSTFEVANDLLGRGFAVDIAV